MAAAGMPEVGGRSSGTKRWQGHRGGQPGLFSRAPGSGTAVPGTEMVPRAQLLSCTHEEGCVAGLKTLPE